MPDGWGRRAAVLRVIFCVSPEGGAERALYDLLKEKVSREKLSVSSAIGHLGESSARSLLRLAISGNIPL
eukprot:9478534-Pyramimonas_sp.AAC.1